MSEVQSDFDWSQIPKNVRVVAVSKLQPVEKIRALHRQRGHVDFGENYVQEALEKIEQTADLPLSWHLIGGLQTNKVKLLAGHFSLIHSVDSLKLAQKISQANLRNPQKILLQINLADEKSKGGFDRKSFADCLPDLQQLPGINVRGLMTMPPLFDNPADARPYFRELRQLLESLRPIWPQASELSMGTSADFKVAIDEGATLLRLGSVLFGARSSAAR